MVRAVADAHTGREVEVLIEIAEGHTNAEIATRLFTVTSPSRTLPPRPA